MIAFDSLVQSLPRLASTAALRCLIFAHGEWPAMAGVRGQGMENVESQMSNEYRMSKYERRQVLVRALNFKLLSSFAVRHSSFSFIAASSWSSLWQQSGMDAGRRAVLPFSLAARLAWPSELP